MTVEHVVISHPTESGISRPLTEQERVQRELNAILGLATRARRENAKEKKTELNTLLSEGLSRASDLAVVRTSFYIGEIADAEVRKRLKGDKDISLVALFEYVDQRICPMIITSKKDKETMQLITNHVARYAPVVPQDEIVQALGRFVGFSVDDKTDILAQTLSWRDDMRQIARKVVANVPLENPNRELIPYGEERRGEVSRRMENISIKASDLRDGRTIKAA